MEAVSTIFDSIIGIVIGLLMIKFADKIAEWIGSILGNSIIRDTNNPWVYKILGSMLAVVSFVQFFI